MTEPSRPPLTFSFFPDVSTFTLTSTDIAHDTPLPNDQVADGWGYQGGNLSPHLAWEGYSLETKSFAVTVHDPDAPTGSGFWHWIVIDLPANITELATGTGTAGANGLPEPARHIRNDAGSFGYMGAAPPGGDVPHRYVYTVHALDVERLEVDDNATAAVVGFNLRFHALGRAQIVPVFGS